MTSAQNRRVRGSGSRAQTLSDLSETCAAMCERPVKLINNSGMSPNGQPLCASLPLFINYVNILKNTLAIIVLSRAFIDEDEFRHRKYLV